MQNDKVHKCKAAAAVITMKSATILGEVCKAVKKIITTGDRE